MSSYATIVENRHKLILTSTLLMGIACWALYLIASLARSSDTHYMRLFAWWRVYDELSTFPTVRQYMAMGLHGLFIPTTGFDFTFGAPHTQYNSYHSIDEHWANKCKQSGNAAFVLAIFAMSLSVVFVGIILVRFHKDHMALKLLGSIIPFTAAIISGIALSVFYRGCVEIFTNFIDVYDDDDDYGLHGRSYGLCGGWLMVAGFIVSLVSVISNLLVPVQGSPKGEPVPVIEAKDLSNVVVVNA